MTLNLHTLSTKPGSRMTRRRVGRGNGSRGTTAGRGTKGQRSRTGGKRGLIRRSLRSLMERASKTRGFTSRGQKFAVLNLSDLERFFSANEIVSPSTLREKNVLPAGSENIKILGNGSLKKPLTVRVQAVSVSAKTAIEKAGGTVVRIGRPMAPKKKED